MESLLKMAKKIYKVYLCKHEGIVVYVGQGYYNRHKHCNSGTSHVYELNKLHFQGVVFDVEVTILDSKDVAVKKERELIKKYLPKFNKDFMQNGKQMIGKERALFKSTWLSHIDNITTTQARRDRLYVVVDEFMAYHTHDMVKEEGLLLRSHWNYEIANLRKIASVVKNLRFGKVTGGMPDIFKETLERTYFDCFGKYCNITWLVDEKLA